MHGVWYGAVGGDFPGFDMTGVEKDKLIDLLFVKNDSLEDRLGLLQTTLERQDKKSEEQINLMKILKTFVSYG